MFTLHLFVVKMYMTHCNYRKTVAEKNKQHGNSFCYEIDNDL